MSLLMDALKKAEAEKKQAAKRLQEVEIEVRDNTSEVDISDNIQTDESNNGVPELFTETAQLTLEPITLEERFVETKGPELYDGDTDSTDEIEVSTVDTSEVDSEDMTLENTISEGIDESFDESLNIVELNDTTIIEGLSTENSSAPYDETFNGVLIDEDEADTEVYEETLPGVGAEQLVKDLGGGKFQPTPVAAKTVFSAGRSKNNHSPFKWGIFIVLALLASGSFAIFYYFTITPVSRNLPSPLIARGVESNGVEAIAVKPPIVKTDAVSGTVISAAVEDAPNEIIEEVNAAQAIPEEMSANVSSSSENITKVDIKQLIADEIKAYEKRAKEDTSVDLTKVKESDNISQKLAEKLSNSSAVNESSQIKETFEITEEDSSGQIIDPTPKNIQLDASLIRISKSKKSDHVNSVVKQAFNAYQDGHYDAAKSMYESVLKSDPDNRDVHFGLAAIAISKQDRKNAYKHYVHLLEINPADSLAMNGLISLSNSADPVKDESAIKLLIQREDDVPYLYFSLGNIYAKQQRWSNAQEAFFDAYRLDNSNTDYVLNLAISLDQIGQYDTALSYYKTAINLSKNSSTTFDPVPVNNRISVLSNLIESKL